MGGRMVFKVFDEDTVNDEIVGAIHLDQKEIIKAPEKGGKNGLFMWKNIYGAPLGYTNKAAVAMNNNPEIASLWKGRILMQVVAEKTEKPVLKVQDITDSDLITKAKEEYAREREYEIMLQVNSAIALPHNDTKYEIQVRIGDHEINTGEPAMYKGTYNRFNFKTEKPSIMKAPYVDVEDMGTVYVYLVGKTTGLSSSISSKQERICYYKAPVTDFLEEDPQVKWCEFLACPAVGEVKEGYKAGLFSFKLTIKPHDPANPTDWKKFPKWKKKLPRRPGNMKARVYIF